MNVGSDTTGLRDSMSPAGSTAIGERAGRSTPARTVDEVLDRLTESSTRFIACAPGRIDMMGGLAEYTGSLVLGMTIEDHACVGVQRHSEANLSIALTASSGLDDRRLTVLAMSQLFGPDGTPIDVSLGRQLIDGDDTSASLCVAGVVAEMVRARLVSPYDDGLSIVVGSTLTGLPAAGRDAALAAATIAAVAAAYDVTLDPLDAAAVCQCVETHWLGVPVGIGDAVCALLGESHTLVAVRSGPRSLADPVRLPDDVVLLGIDCGAMRPEAQLKYERGRTAAFMGRGLIDRIIQHDGAGNLQWDGHLARISVPDYVERFRNRLPTTLKGSVYLERFGETGDPLTRIDPDCVYKIRSRTEHHIYEHARACQFAEFLTRATRDESDGPLVEAGELMYASHWSYGQRCALGSIETDLLVNLIRGHGTDADIYGAKVTARGCGGVVAVLMRAGARPAAAIDAAVKKYQSKTGRRATLLRGSSPGVLVSGVRKL